MVIWIFFHSIYSGFRKAADFKFSEAMENGPFPLAGGNNFMITCEFGTDTDWKFNISTFNYAFLTHICSNLTLRHVHAVTFVAVLSLPWSLL